MVFQLGAALLEACVLSALSGGDAWGYVITQAVQRFVGVSESALYPVLRRLQKEGCLTTSDRPFPGRNRRYYSLTETGRARLAECRAEWTLYKDRVDQILGERGVGVEDH
jgi:PadR family transcriptional regulator PadR